jgi:hypothetical protein
LIYKTENIQANVEPAKCLAIDHGIDNWLTGISNAGTSFIIDGKHLKSLNQGYIPVAKAVKTYTGSNPDHALAKPMPKPYSYDLRKKVIQAIKLDGLRISSRESTVQH